MEGSSLERVLQLLADDVAELKHAEQRSGSRYVGPGADVEVVKRIAEGGSVERPGSDWKIAEPRSYGTKAESGVGFLRQVKAARLGDPRAHEALTEKSWLGTTDSAGGFLVPPEQLPGYLEARRAASPLRERCRRSDERWPGP